MFTKFAAGLTLAATTAQAAQWGADPTPAWIGGGAAGAPAWANGSGFQPSNWESASFEPSFGGDSWGQPAHQHAPEPAWGQSSQQQWGQPAHQHAPEPAWGQPAQQQWGQPAHQQWGQPTQQQWGQPTQQQWGQPTQQPTGPAHDPWSSTPNHHTPWQPTAPEKPEGWYSPTQQYITPTKKYVPAATKPRFAHCGNELGEIELAQLPGHGTYVRTEFQGNPSLNYDIVIGTKGIIGDGFDSDCLATGPEFNPMTETDKYGNVLPFQDPARGRITLPDTEDNGDVILEGDVPYMIQLEGEDSIIGRSLIVAERDSGTYLGCCIVGLDMGPMVETPAPAVQPANHSHPH